MILIYCMLVGWPGFEFPFRATLSPVAIVVSSGIVYSYS